MEGQGGTVRTRTPSPRGGYVDEVLHVVGAEQRSWQERPCRRTGAFDNASIEYDDPQHPARIAAREYRTALHGRVHDQARRLLPASPEAAAALAGQIATLIDGAYTRAAHLGPAGPAAAGLALAHQLVDQAAEVA